MHRSFNGCATFLPLILITAGDCKNAYPPYIDGETDTELKKVYSPIRSVDRIMQLLMFASKASVDLKYILIKKKKSASGSLHRCDP